MISKDLHVHTKFSTDSSADPWDVANAAVQKGLTEICFTDHEDIGFDDIGTFTFEPEERFKALKEVQKAYAGRIKIGIGVELGLLTGNDSLEQKILSFAKDYPWDYIIGSTHMIPAFKRDGYMDPVEELSCFFTYGTKTVFDRYYDFILNNVRYFDCFDTLGHLDYLCRYVPQGAEPYALEDHLPVIEEILKTIIRKGKNLEINTKGLYSSLGRQNPEDAIIALYKELGGTRIVFGSDAHTPDKVGGCFDSPVLKKYQD